MCRHVLVADDLPGRHRHIAVCMPCSPAGLLALQTAPSMSIMLLSAGLGTQVALVESFCILGSFHFTAACRLLSPAGPLAPQVRSARPSMASSRAQLARRRQTSPLPRGPLTLPSKPWGWPRGPQRLQGCSPLGPAWRQMRPSGWPTCPAMPGRHYRPASERAGPPQRQASAQPSLALNMPAVQRAGFCYAASQQDVPLWFVQVCIA